MFDQIHTLSIQPSTAAVCLALAAVIGLGSSVLPALAAAKTSIVEAVRDAG